ncbi:hypothetical protein [Myxococcus sp. CA033]|uniref:hypothetical protein n=1 Tax=Myxococcus sp. CA033 TaxID=2741516 RepID=UPI00352C4F98
MACVLLYAPACLAMAAWVSSLGLPSLFDFPGSEMSISVLNRSCFSLPHASTSTSQPVSAPVQGVESTAARQPRNDVWQKLMTDSFEPAPTRPGSSRAAGVPSGASSASDAGPGFGAPSAGSTQQANPSEPWLSRNNVGSPYNSNMLLIDPGQKSQYKYTNTFTNNTGQPQTVTLWNKTGENGGPNDGQNFDKSTPKTFTLQPGQSQVVAFDTNSSVAWCVSKDGTANPGANSGQTWGEATFANAGTGWSGYDTSQISPAGHNGNMSIKNDAGGATVTQANAWQTPSDDPAGRDVGVPAGPLNLTTTFS